MLLSAILTSVFRRTIWHTGGFIMEQYCILVVDDDREIVRSLGKLLEREGYGVKKAYDGKEALDLLLSETIHLIILDVMMPQASA